MQEIAQVEQTTARANTEYQAQQQAQQQAVQAVNQLVGTAQGFVGSNPYAQWPGEYSRTTGLWQPPTDAQAIQLLAQGMAAQSACLAAGGLADCQAAHDPLTQYELNQAHVDLGGLLRGLIPGVGCYRASGNASAGNIASCVLGLLPVAGTAVKILGAGVDVGAEAAGAGADTGTATAQVLLNQAAGNAFRDATASQLASDGWSIVATEFRVNTPFGARITDILAERNGELAGFETKLGSSPYLSSQLSKDIYIGRFGGTLPDGSVLQYPTVLIRG